jgi:glucosamine--fructose-6-phosphate aminotransferase (isomerizing)
MFVARSFLYPIALEGALKLKELAYIPTEGIASGELKHGPIALVDENLISICLLSKYILQNKSESSVQEILARNGDYIVIADYSPDVQSGIVSKNVLNIQTITQGLDSFVLPLAYIPAIQLISCYTATIMKLDVDKPRNLAKSVTDE